MKAFIALLLAFLPASGAHITTGPCHVTKHYVHVSGDKFRVAYRCEG